MSEVLIFILTTMAPITELRIGIPLGLRFGLPASFVIPVAFIFNCLIFFPIYLGLTVFYRFLKKYHLFNRGLERVQRKVSPYIERYGILGLAVFVGIPLPITGAWTGTIAAWLLGLNWKKSFLAICLGVGIATIIISAISLGFLGGLQFLLNGHS